ncbi:hypothetical protein SBI_09733 [Streptomyces bingchenggensis BCW-1]|uniref:Uncharacterized protein n=1 Tax=Streptomyces bingchenggensis (strain BCW-1) TaxID=749414 RepID=D7CBH4_STRBB|nr:hypothetical protein SBI_09733 [Streptomyces bingchenggensis BCW-1]
MVQMPVQQPQGQARLGHMPDLVRDPGPSAPPVIIRPLLGQEQLPNEVRSFRNQMMLQASCSSPR